jgi:16S rRNA (uracil1498-N3)-methyltransferase
LPFFKQKFIAYCFGDKRKLLTNEYKVGEDATILIGPEGDFSPEEVQIAIDAGFIPVSLGDFRLRTETAALVACTAIALLNNTINIGNK